MKHLMYNEAFYKHQRNKTKSQVEARHIKKKLECINIINEKFMF